MKTTKHGELVYNHDDLCDLVMQGHDVVNVPHLQVDTSVDLETAAAILTDLSLIHI